MAKLADINLLSVGHTIGLAGAVFTGEGKLYLVMFPNCRGEVFSGQGKVLFQETGSEVEQQVDTLDLDDADWKTFLDQADQLNTEVVARAADGTLEKAILRKGQRTLETGVQWRVFKRDRYTCRYCANDSTPLTVDHLVLWEEGGPSIEANLVSACRKCNKTRGNKSYADWLNSPDYKRLSVKLDEATRKANLDLLPTLDAIPRLVHKRSR
jgi:hypothetical protein